MNPGQAKMDKATAELLAEQFAASQKHMGPWTGYVEYYDAADTIKAAVTSTDTRTASKPKPGKVPV